MKKNLFGIIKIGFLAISALLTACSSSGGGTAPDQGNPPGEQVIGDYIYIPGGEFRMGSPAAKFDFDERPLHTVWLDGYYISAFEVTNEEYADFLSHASNPGRHWRQEMEIIQEGVLFRPKLGREKYPVSFVTWHDAVAYCASLDGRLPTEAEWEKSARGPRDERIFPWGNHISYGQANYFNPDGLWEVGTSTGKSFYGCNDMSGNVWEWTADWYDPQYYAESPYRNPPGPVLGDNRSIRGGSFRSESELLLRCSDRYALDPALKYIDLGFRCVIDSAVFAES